VHNWKKNMMKSTWLVCIALLLLRIGVVAEKNNRGGIVYGPKAAFNISAPEGWVLDNESGVNQGQPCVLYPKGSTWQDAKTVMYAKIASTEFEDVKAFVAFAIKGMQEKHGLPKEKIESGKTKDGRPYFINEYPATKNYSQWERVAYVQLPHAVAYIVLSSRDQASYRKDAPALTEAVKSVFYLEVKADSASPPAVSPAPTPVATASRFTSLSEAIAEADRNSETSEGKGYDYEFSAAVQSRLADVVHECAKDSKLPIVFDVVFIFAADGRVESTLQTPDQSAALCVADKLRNVRLPAPPRAGWPFHLHVELNPGKENAKKRSGPNPATSKDVQLWMQAGKAGVAGNYEEALRLYAQAIKLKGPSATFVYHNRGMLYLNRAKASTDRHARIADLQKAIADFKTSIDLGAASDDELNRGLEGLEKVGSKAHLEEATKLLSEETAR
jgi:tetratricopeptide (TPR) repeat protein